MNDTFLYIHSFSKKKSGFILSALLFLYHLFGGLYVLLNWFHSDLWFTVSEFVEKSVLYEFQKDKGYLFDNCICLRCSDYEHICYVGGARDSLSQNFF